MTEIKASLPDGTPSLLTVEAVGINGERGKPMRVRREPVTMSFGQQEITRTQFPLVPAFACTVHRTQGSTIPGDVHILCAPKARSTALSVPPPLTCRLPVPPAVNREFFAHGQAYVALSRVTSLMHIHFWELHLDAFTACPSVANQYELLRLRPLTRDYVQQRAPARQRVVALLPMSDLPAMRARRAAGGR